jgi:hypothetical protein
MVLKTQLEQLSVAAEVAVNYLPSSSSSAGLCLPSQLEQLPGHIQDFVADKMDLKAVSLGFTKGCSDDLAVDLYAEAMAHALNVTMGLGVDPVGIYSNILPFVICKNHCILNVFISFLMLVKYNEVIMQETDFD